MENTPKQNRNILASIIPLSILFVLVQAASLIGFFHVSFKAVEEYAIQKNLQSCIYVVQMELVRISGLVYEWSAWDDTVLFINGRNPNYIQDNAAEDSMREQNLNVFCIVDPNGKPVWTRCVKIQDEHQEGINLSLFTADALKNNPALWEHNNPDSCITGYYSTNEGVLMLCSRPVFHSSQKDLIQGAVIMGRFVTDKFLESITRQDCRDFEWWNLSSEYTREAMQQYLSRITDENPVYVETTQAASVAYTILPDINGKATILIKFVMPNDIATFKKGWLFRCAAIYGIEGLVFIAYLAAFANKHCIRCQSQTQRDILETAVAESISITQPDETLQYEDELPI